VLEGLHTWQKGGELLSVIEIKKALEKAKSSLFSRDFKLDISILGLQSNFV
jgi:hypothetical protein